jgi:hypothetical protein
MEPNAPSPFLMFLLMIVLISAFCAFVIVAGGLLRMARGETFWPRDQTETRPSPARLKPRSRHVRGARGRLSGSRSVVPSKQNDEEPRSKPGTALERAGTDVPPVPGSVPVSLSVPEMLQITVLLTKGMSPSAIAKQLPGYRGEKYNEYVERVRQVKALLDQQPAEAPAAESLAYQPLATEGASR